MCKFPLAAWPPKVGTTGEKQRLERVGDFKHICSLRVLKKQQATTQNERQPSAFPTESTRDCMQESHF